MVKSIVSPEMAAMSLIAKTREYLDYLERHIRNVQRAWCEIQEKCDVPFIWDDYRFHSLHEEVSNHDISKLSAEEFVQFRQAFYPADTEKKGDISAAWEHHKDNNPHHWENWTKNEGKEAHPYASEMHCTHMVIDWLAMSYEFGDTPRKYYEKNKERIDLPEWAKAYINTIFDQLEQI